MESAKAVRKLLIKVNVLSNEAAIAVRAYCFIESFVNVIYLVTLSSVRPTHDSYKSTSGSRSGFADFQIGGCRPN